MPLWKFDSDWDRVTLTLNSGQVRGYNSLPRIKPQTAGCHLSHFPEPVNKQTSWMTMQSRVVLIIEILLSDFLNSSFDEFISLWWSRQVSWLDDTWLLWTIFVLESGPWSTLYGLSMTWVIDGPIILYCALASSLPGVCFHLISGSLPWSACSEPGVINNKPVLMGPEQLKKFLEKLSSKNTI